MPSESSAIGEPSLRERREFLWIGKLRRLACFEQILKKLVDGQSVTIVSRWLVSLKLDGELKDAGYEALRKYVTALNFRVKSALEGVERNTAAVTKAQRAVIEAMERQSGMIIPEEIPNGEKPIWRLAQELARDLDAEMMLKYCFLLQMARVEQICDIEKKTGVLLRDGYKNVAILVRIAAEKLKCELGGHYFMGKGISCDGPSSGDLMSTPDFQPTKPDPRFSELDEAQRSNLRAAAVRVVEGINWEIGVETQNDPMPAGER